MDKRVGDVAVATLIIFRSEIIAPHAKCTSTEITYLRNKSTMRQWENRAFHAVCSLLRDTDSAVATLLLSSSVMIFPPHSANISIHLLHDKRL